MSGDFRNHPGYLLAMALDSLRRENEDFAQARADHKEATEKLQAEITRLKTNILTGQKELPLEPVIHLDAGPALQATRERIERLMEEDAKKFAEETEQASQ